MKNPISFGLAASILALAAAAFPHPAAAQMAFVASTDSLVTMPSESVATLNAITLPKAGTYVISGQQTFVAYPTSTATPLYCWMANKAGSSTPLATAPAPFTTIAPPGGYATLPLNGYLAVTAATTIWLECRYNNTEIVESTGGALMATQVK